MPARTSPAAEPARSDRRPRTPRGVQPGTLYIVATPIGNLDDITLRAARVLGEVDRIACEDTRVTAKLCRHLGVVAPLLRHEAHNEAASTEGIVRLLAEGLSIALVSDAGTPALSDPGQRLVAACAGAGYGVVPIPGPSALTTAISVSGLALFPLIFHGFVPKKTNERRAAFARLGAGTHAWFVPARDLARVTRELAEAAPRAQVVIARELTKRYETLYRGEAAELAGRLAENPDAARGEAVLLARVVPTAEEASDEAIREALDAERARGATRRDAAAYVAATLGVPKRRAYQLAFA